MSAPNDPTTTALLLEDDAALTGLALEVTGLGVFDFDPSTGAPRFSARARAIWGLAADEEPSVARIRELMHPADPHLGDTVADSLRADGPGEFAIEHRIVRPDGAVRWVRATGRTVFEGSGTARRAVRSLGTMLDVTEQVESFRTLAATQTRLDLATRAGGIGIFDYDVAHGTIVWDERVRDIFGIGPDEPVTYATFVACVHPDDRAATDASVTAALDPDGTRRYEGDYRVIRRGDGAIRWVHASGHVFFAGRAPVRLIGTVQDVTERRAAERRLASAVAELERADRRKDEFLAMLSHELRNPLAPIRTAAQLLASPNLRDDQLAWARQVIQRQVAHMAWLLDDLLDLARITRGKLELKRQRVTLTAVVDAAVEAARPLLDRKNHRLVVRLPADAPRLDADPLRLSQVLSNLLTNAAKYTDPGGHIELSALVEGGAMLLAVADDGIGIESEALPRLFEMFSQVDGSGGRAEGGLGIGLALVKGLVELHGGAVEARSPGRGRGSTFVVRLPLPAESRPVSRPVADAPPSVAQGRRVLVADDNGDAADTLGLLLGLSGHDVRVAHGGRGALALAQAFRPEVAVLDIGMPDLDGYEVARQLRQEAWAAGLRLIALTGWGQDEDKRRAEQAGFDAHLTKPVDPERLEAMVAQGRLAPVAPEGAARAASAPSGATGPRARIAAITDRRPTRPAG